MDRGKEVGIRLHTFSKHNARSFGSHILFIRSLVASSKLCRANVCALVLAQGARLAGLGIAIGLSASLVLTRALSSELFGVSATDPLTYAGVALLLCAVALLACYIPETQRGSFTFP
jgi:hypothetical protein